jgi:hypothetical protein
MKSLLIAVVSLGLATFVASAQTLVASNATANTSIPATTLVAAPEYTGTFYYVGEEGKLVALPRVQMKIGKMGGASVSVPSDVPTTTTLVIKLEGTGDPVSSVRMAIVEKGGKIPMALGDMTTFKKPAEFGVNAHGNRIFEVTPKTGGGGDYVVTLKGNDPFAMPDMFVFHVGGAK